jgi:UDP-N-acetylmuramate dehydrogenase
VPGVVVRLDSPEFQGIEELPDGRLRVGAGCDLMALVRESARRGLAGLECLAGVPGTVGGAVRMNAGGVHGDIGARVAGVQVLGHDGVLREAERRELAFGYRSSELPGLLVTRVDLALEQADPIVVRERVKEYFAQKKRSQPMAEHSAGCCFRNPSVGEPAGRLIDRAGLKGTRLGGAEVSKVHANFIVAHAGARADDVAALMERVRAGVLDRFGVELKREVVLWPDEGDLLAPAPVLS